MLVALTREVSPTIGRCELTHKQREPIDVALARAQHQQYEDCLAELGCVVRRLPPAPELPDAVFVEDTCVVLDELAVITRPGPDSRRPETASVAQAMRAFRKLHFIEPPGTLDGGDVLCLGRDVFVGVSGRTNRSAVDQLQALLTLLGYTVSAVSTTGCLHLKTAVTQVADRTILVNPSWVDPGVFGPVTVIAVDPSEPFAANALRVGETVVHSTACPRTRGRLEAQGLRARPIDLSELARAEGGLTCCSLLFGAE